MNSLEVYDPLCHQSTSVDSSRVLGLWWLGLGLPRVKR